MPVTYIGLLSNSGSATSADAYTPAVHPNERAGHVQILTLWLPSAVTEMWPSTNPEQWTYILNGDVSVGDFKVWMLWRVTDAQPVQHMWNDRSPLYGANTLVVDGADTEDPFQVGPLLSGGTSGQTLSLPSMTPTEAGGMAVHFLTARYATGASSKSIGTVTGHTMSTPNASLSSGAGHAVRFARRDNVPANTATGALSTTATATTTGWRVLSGVLREPRPWSPQNKQFHTHA